MSEETWLEPGESPGRAPGAGSPSLAQDPGQPATAPLSGSMVCRLDILGKGDGVPFGPRSLLVIMRPQGLKLP